VPACHVTGVQLTDMTPCARSILAMLLLSCPASLPARRFKTGLPAAVASLHAARHHSTTHTHMRTTPGRPANRTPSQFAPHFIGRATPPSRDRRQSQPHIRQRRAGFETGLGGWVGLGWVGARRMGRDGTVPHVTRGEAGHELARSPRNERHPVRQLRTKFKFCAGSHARV
jgi:hypothetical protein